MNTIKEDYMKQKIKIHDLQSMNLHLSKFVSIQNREFKMIRIKGVIGTLTFMKRLIRMPHDSDFSVWEPILKRRLIRMLHQLEGYKKFPSFSDRVYENAECGDHLLEACSLFRAMYNVIAKSRDILKRLADVDCHGASLQVFPGVK